MAEHGLASRLSRTVTQMNRSRGCSRVTDHLAPPRDAEARATRSPHGRDRRPGGSRQDKRCAREDQPPMKPSARRIERLLAKVEADLACSARPRRYCFYFGEEA